MQVYRLFLPSSPTGVTTPLFLASKLEPIREAGLSSFISSELNYLTSRGRGWFVQVCFRALLRGRFGEMNFFPPRPLAPFLPHPWGIQPVFIFHLCFSQLTGITLQNRPSKPNTKTNLRCRKASRHPWGKLCHKHEATQKAQNSPGLGFFHAVLPFSVGELPPGMM